MEKYLIKDQDGWFVRRENPFSMTQHRELAKVYDYAGRALDVAQALRILDHKNDYNAVPA